MQHVEYLIGYGGDAFAHTGNAEQDPLSITAVHPMREDAVRRFLPEGETGWTIIDKLVNKGRPLEIDYEGQTFSVRRFQRRRIG